MFVVVKFISSLIEIYIWVVIVSAILSWLIAFGVVDLRNAFVSAVARLSYRLTEPIYAPLRRFLPNLGGIDISPMIVILVLIFFRNFLRSL